MQDLLSVVVSRSYDWLHLPHRAELVFVVIVATFFMMAASHFSPLPIENFDNVVIGTFVVSCYFVIFAAYFLVYRIAQNKKQSVIGALLASLALAAVYVFG